MNEPQLEGTCTELAPSVTIKNIQPIRESDSKLQQKADIRKLVEEPLISACERLYDLNLCTWRSSANFQDIAQGHGVISIDFPSLSDRNKIIAKKLVEEGKAELFTPEEPRLVGLIVPLNKASTVAEVSEAAFQLVRYFKKQKMTWATKYSLGQMRNWLKSPDKTPEEIAQENNLFYDPETQTFFLNEEQCLKTKEIIIEDEK